MPNEEDKKYERQMYSFLIPLFASVVVGSVLIGIVCLVVKLMKWLAVH